ncbi:MAG: divalent-cation tolerance protein CutA [Opitutales bacterium]
MQNESPKIGVGWTTVETLSQAEALASGMLQAKLAACVQIEGPVRSHYVWQGAIHADPEYRLMVKFDWRLESELQAWIQQKHPYETPEWVALPMTAALPAYAAWVVESPGSAG